MLTDLEIEKGKGINTQEFRRFISLIIRQISYLKKTLILICVPLYCKK